MLAKLCFFPAKAADPETGTTFDFLNADVSRALGSIAIGVQVCLHTSILTANAWFKQLKRGAYR